MRIEAVVFDLGGTLIEYAGEYALWPDLEAPGLAAAHYHLTTVGINTPTLERFQEAGFEILPRRWRMAMNGEKNLTVPSLLTEILAIYDIDTPKAAILRSAADKYERAICSASVPISHGMELLSQLKKNGYHLGLLSNTMFTGTVHQEDLKRFNLDIYFDAMLFSGDANKWKPNPAPYHQVLSELGVDPEASVFVGDDPFADILGARRANMHAIHFRSSERFKMPKDLVPDATILSLQELPSVLTGLNNVA
ncbi:MAG: HAD family hydrolase [Deltaproteobacteria bacterium]|nr:HAD family hydrolase [Deltaproteobacteria bacterium]